MLTDFFSSLRAQSGIQGVSMGQRNVAFVLTLFTFYKKKFTIQSILLIYNKIYKVEHTWPPGPELLENESSTDPRKIDSPLNIAIHFLASFDSSEFVRDESGGGRGSVPVVDFARARRYGLMCVDLSINRVEPKTWSMSCKSEH